MRFNSYFVRLSHAESAFSGSVTIAGNQLIVGFKKLADGLFIAFFKNQVELHFQEQIPFKKIGGCFIVLLPVLTKYNQRKLKKIAGLLSEIENAPLAAVLADLIAIDKFIEAEQLLEFFSLSRKQAISLLVQLELEKKLKLVDFQHLAVIHYDHFQELAGELKNELNQAYENGERSIKLSQLEKKLKLSQTMLLFKYLLRRYQDEMAFKIVKNTLVWKRIPLSEGEKEKLGELEKVLKRNHFVVFTVEDVQKVSGLEWKPIQDALWYLLNEEKLVQLNERYFILTEDLNRIINRVKKFKRNQGEMIDINSLRNLTSLSRKYIIILFEYFDARHYTVRLGNNRKILISV